eukprot:11846562-Alexandrium_andersonii.AAC.1
MGRGFGEGSSGAGGGAAACLCTCERRLRSLALRASAVRRHPPLRTTTTMATRATALPSPCDGRLRGPSRAEAQTLSARLPSRALSLSLIHI